MASVTFTIASQTKTFTVSAQNVTRIVDALNAVFDPTNTLTNAQVFDLWANSAMQALRDVVKRTEGDAAADAARATITDVDVT